MNNDSVAFLVPTTTRNCDWNHIEDTHLYTLLLRSLSLYTPHIYITLYLGYDIDDPIYSQESERDKINTMDPKFAIQWIPCHRDPGNVVRIWNKLGQTAINDGFEWMMVLGDDIKLPTDANWLRLFQKAVKKNQHLGWAAGWSNNNAIATQFLLHKTHWEIFGFIYPPQLRNYYCDDFLNEIYPEKYKYWRKDYPLLNLGGDPRYIPENDRNICSLLVKRHKPTLNRFIQDMNHPTGLSQ